MGKLKKYISKWKKLTNDQWVLSTVMGYKIEFDKKPYQRKIPRPIVFNNEEKVLIQKEVSDMLFKGAIKEVPHEENEYISNIFLVKKKNGKYRPVINLKKLNEYVSYNHFKQENLDLILKGIRKDSYFTSLDLTDAYFSISVDKTYRKYLKFVWDKKLYAFQCLPFGLASSPRVFTKVLKVIFSHIRRMGIDSYFYIDDSLLQADNYLGSVQNTEKVQKFIQSVGFDINHEKSNFIPSQRITFLGYIIDSVLFKVFLPDEKVQKIIEMSKMVLKNEKVLIRDVAKLIGLFSSARYAITNAHLFHRYLDIEKTQALVESNGNYNSYMCISDKGKTEVQWWLNNIQIRNGRAIREKSPSHYLHCDASMDGWGTFLDNKSQSTQGRWSLQEQEMHINVLEMKAILFGLTSLCKDTNGVHIQVKSDSSTAVSYINNQGGSVLSLLEITKQIWFWCINRNLFISAVHIPGKDNIIPDNLSRCFKDTSEWKLKVSIFRKILKQFFVPEIDLFASRINKQLDLYVSWYPDPHAWATDAFSFSWHDINPYIFCPFSQIGRVLTKIREDQVRKAIIIVPLWTTQTWFPTLLKLLIASPIQLPQCSDLLTLVHNQQKHPMNKRKLFLIACMVSGDISCTKAFQTELQKSWQILGENPQINNTNMLGGNGYCGVVNDRLIPLLQM